MALARVQANERKTATGMPKFLVRWLNKASDGSRSRSGSVEAKRFLTKREREEQVEVTEATVTVYFDQLHRCEASEIVRAVKRWVSTCDEPYRRLPTVGELRAIMRDGKSQIDPKVAWEMKLVRLVKSARARGLSTDNNQALIESFNRKRTPAALLTGGLGWWISVLEI